MALRTPARRFSDQETTYSVVRIGEGTWIGSAAVVMADVGPHAVIGAGAVVTKPLPGWVVAAGVPARVVRMREGAPQSEVDELERAAPRAADASEVFVNTDRLARKTWHNERICQRLFEANRIERINMSVWQDCREMVTEQVTYRDLLYQMTKRDLLLRYKQTVMGFGWAIFMPLVNTAVFSVIFMRVAPIDAGMPYPLFAFTRPADLELLRLVAASSRSSR